HIDIEKHFRLVDNWNLGLNEVDALFPDGRFVTEYVDGPGEFVKFAEQYSGKALVYAGLNPRPFRFHGKKKRAKDEDIEMLLKEALR
ncbi:MAG: hypothetical protein JSV55_00540, partial [Deltaproteobacteria bacterium]